MIFINSLKVFLGLAILHLTIASPIAAPVNITTPLTMEKRGLTSAVCQPGGALTCASNIAIPIMVGETPSIYVPPGDVWT